MKTLLIIILLIINVEAYSQNKQSGDFIYKDLYGDTIIIKTGILIDQIDTAFFKKNLSGFSFKKDLLSNDARYKITINGLKRIKRNKEYNISVMIIKQNPKVEDIISSMGLSNYVMIIKKVDENFKIDSMTFLSNEI